MLRDYTWINHPSASFVEALKKECLSWEGTRYCEGVRIKQRGVDCINFLCSVLDECLNIHSAYPKRILSDVALNQPEESRKCMREMVSRYWPYIEVEDKTIRPGDAVLTQVKNSGPMHGMIVGFEKNTLWHIAGQTSEVTKTGILIPGMTLTKIYRKA